MLSYPAAPSRSPALYVTRSDYAQLSVRADALGHTLVGQSLQSELERAILAPDSSSRAFIRLGSTIGYEDLSNGAIRRLKLCLPEDANLDDSRLSVLTPVGAALIGAGVGQVLQYIGADGRARQLRVLEIGDDH